MNEINIHGILSATPHRYPFLLVDRILELVPNKNITAIKNVTINEPFFHGHFPELPVMPGVLIIEAMAQAAGILASKSSGQSNDGDDALFYLAGIDNARFKQVVSAGDQLLLEANVIQSKKNLWKFATTAKVNQTIVCSATILGAYKELTH